MDSTRFEFTKGILELLQLLKPMNLVVKTVEIYGFYGFLRFFTVYGIITVRYGTVKPYRTVYGYGILRFS